MNTRTCSKCNVTKPLAAFHRLWRSRDGRQSWCKHCKAMLTRLSKYGNDGVAIYIAQGGRCAICKQQLKREWHLDHRHDAAGTVRGVLCCNCNIAIGLLKDRLPVVGAAFTYLRRYTVMRNYWRL